MRYYIKDQVSSTLKRKGTYIYVAVILVLCILANISMLAFRTIYGINDGSFGYNLLLFAEWCFVIPYYSTVFIARIVIGNECPNPKIKNKVTIGLKRYHLYFGQLISELISAAAFLLVAGIAFVGITYLFMAADGSIELWAIGDFCQKVLISIPLWVAGVSLGHMFIYIWNDKIYSFLSFFAVVILLPRLVMLFAAEPFHIGLFVWIRDYILLTPRFQELPYFYTLNIPQIIVTSCIYIVISNIIGLVVYYKREY